MKNSEYLSKVESNMAPKRLFWFAFAATFPSRISNNPQMTIEIPAQNGCPRKNRTPAPMPDIKAMKLKALGPILRLTKR